MSVLLDQRVVDAEVLGRQQAALLRHRRMNSAMTTSALSNRSLFLLNTEWFHAASLASDFQQPVRRSKHTLNPHEQSKRPLEDVLWQCRVRQELSLL